MANGNAFDHALECAQMSPTLDVGVHLVLVQGESIATPGRALPETLKDLASALLRREIDPNIEATAQVQRIVDAGIRPSHIDTHKHTHLFPSVLSAIAKVAKEFDIPWVRRPFDYGTGPTAGMIKQAVSTGMKLMKPNFAKTLEGFHMTDYFTGFQITGTLDTKAMLETIETLPKGLTEFMCHPGRCTSELRAAPTRLKESREKELAALTSPDVRRAIEKRGIVLTSYRAIA